MLNFLASAGKALVAPAGNKPLTIVAGNEACDVDSLVSAVGLARLLSLKYGAQGEFAPLVAIERADFRLRTDCLAALRAAYPDEHAQIAAQLLFLDALPAAAAAAAAAAPARLVLTDHNAPALSLTRRLNNAFAVVGIVDHHADERKHTHCELMRIVEPVGSASSLVTNLFTANNLAHAIDAPLATLLLCPILLDTVNLDPAAGRLTPQDAEASSFLISVIQRDDPGFSASSLFEALQRAKFDTSSLTCLEMLRKDYKQTSCGRGVIGHKIELGISSVGASWDNLTAREDCANNSGKAVEVIRDFMESKKLEVFVIMTAFETCGIFKREMIVFSSLNKPKLFRGLMDDTEIQLSDQNPSLYKPFLKSHEDMQLYDVGNLKMSRKIFQPILVRIITSLA